jgi:hypothetical protein
MPVRFEGEHRNKVESSDGRSSGLCQTLRAKSFSAHHDERRLAFDMNFLQSGLTSYDRSEILRALVELENVVKHGIFVRLEHKKI